MTRLGVLSLACVYLLLSFPQPLFAYAVDYKGFTVYSSAPLDDHIYAVLDRALSRVVASPLYVGDVRPNVFLTW